MDHGTAAGHGPVFVEVSDCSLSFSRVGLAEGPITARRVLKQCGLAPEFEYVVLQWRPDGDVEEVGIDDPVETWTGEAPRLIAEKSDRTFRLRLDDRSIVWPKARIGEVALRTLGSIPAERTIVLRRDGSEHVVETGASVDLTHSGTEVLYVRDRIWKLNVQGVVIESHEPLIVAGTAIERAGFDAGAAWIIVLKSASGRRQISIGDTIDLREPGIEKLRLTPREINNGEAGSSPPFPLLPKDECGLRERGIAWTTEVHAGRRWLMLHDMSLPAGYDASAVTIAVEVPLAYPMAQLDMFYCYPGLLRLDGQPIPQTQVTETIGGRVFQRWSRHRGQLAPWRPGVDSVLTHLALIDASLVREVE